MVKGSSIVRFLGLESLSKKIERFDNTLKSLKDLDIEKSEISDEFSKKYESYQNMLSGQYSEDIVKSVSSRWENYLSKHTANLSTLRKKEVELEKEKADILKNETISKSYKELLAFDKAKELYKGGDISNKAFDSIIKAKNGVVKYADSLVFNEKGELLLLQRSKADEHGGKWVLPGGHVDLGEDFETAAKRELQEEAGISISECKNVGSYKDNGVEIEYFQSEINSNDTPIIVEDSETQDYVWVDIHKDLDKYDMVFNMKDNIIKILGLEGLNSKKIIKKAIADGLVNVSSLADLIKSKEEYSENHLVDMIEEHERLVKLLTPYAEKDEKIKKELAIQKQELAEYKKELASLKSVEKAFENNLISKETFELIKARTGTYSDNAQNRKLKRVGQKYGSSGKADESESKEGKKEEDVKEPKQQSPEELAESAKNSSESQLQNAIKESNSPDVRQAAHNELKRRQSEEHSNDEKFGESKKEEKVDKKEDEQPKEVGESKQSQENKDTDKKDKKDKDE